MGPNCGKVHPAPVLAAGGKPSTWLPPGTSQSKLSCNENARHHSSIREQNWAYDVDARKNGISSIASLVLSSSPSVSIDMPLCMWQE